MTARAVLFAVAATLLSGLILLLSLAPVERIPRFGPSALEHAAAYGGALAVLLALAGRFRLVLALAATALAGLLEVVQPVFGRSAEWSDFAGSAGGIWLAFAAVAGLSRLGGRRAALRPPPLRR